MGKLQCKMWIPACAGMTWIEWDWWAEAHPTIHRNLTARFGCGDVEKKTLFGFTEPFYRLPVNSSPPTAASKYYGFCLRSLPILR